ncbi:MAG: hypothetical protein RLZZ436_4140 [Planctomycetota bacterium]
MAIEAICQGCEKQYRLKDEYAGKKIRCPDCRGLIEVPADSDDAGFDSDAESPVPVGGRVAGRTERDYTHLRCSQSTTVDGPEFRALADPLAGMVATWCSNCEQNFPLDQFVWSDTQEKVTDYYKRYQNMGTPPQNFMASRSGMYGLGTVPFLCGLIGFFVWKNQWFIPSGLLISLIIMFLHTIFLAPSILRLVVGTSDARELI